MDSCPAGGHLSVPLRTRSLGRGSREHLPALRRGLRGTAAPGCRTVVQSTPLRRGVVHLARLVKSGARIIQQRSKVMLHSESSARVFGLRGTGFLSALGVVASIALAEPALAQNPAAPAAPAPSPVAPAAGDTASADASFDRLISAELGRPGGLTS